MYVRGFINNIFVYKELFLLSLLGEISFLKIRKTFFSFYTFFFNFVFTQIFKWLFSNDS